MPQNPKVVEADDVQDSLTVSHTRLDLSSGLDGDSQKHRDMAKRWSQSILSQRTMPELESNHVNRLDQLKVEADKLGISVEKYLDMKAGLAISDKDLALKMKPVKTEERARARFLDETS